MRERSEMILGDLVQIRAEQKPDLDVLTFEHLSLDGGKHPRRGPHLRGPLHGRQPDRGCAGGARDGARRPVWPDDAQSPGVRGDDDRRLDHGNCVFVPIDPRTKGDKLAYMLRNAGCRGAVCADYSLREVLSVKRANPDIGLDPRARVRGGRGRPAALRSQPARSRSRRCSPSRLRRWTSRLERPSWIRSRSSTRRGPQENPRVSSFRTPASAAYAIGRALIAGSPEEDRPYTGLSLTHGNAQAVTLGPSLALGLRAGLQLGASPSRSSGTSAAPTAAPPSRCSVGMATAIYSEPEKPDDGDNPVRLVTSAGMPAAIWESFEKRFQVDIFEWYGAIEGGLAFKPVGQGPGRLLRQARTGPRDEDPRRERPGVPARRAGRDLLAPAATASRPERRVPRQRGRLGEEDARRLAAQRRHRPALLGAKPGGVVAQRDDVLHRALVDFEILVESPHALGENLGLPRSTRRAAAGSVGAFEVLLQLADLLILGGEIPAGFFQQLLEGTPLLLQGHCAFGLAPQLALASGEGVELGLQGLPLGLEIRDLLALLALARLDGKQLLPNSLDLVVDALGAPTHAPPLMRGAIACTAPMVSGSPCPTYRDRATNEPATSSWSWPSTTASTWPALDDPSHCTGPAAFSASVLVKVFEVPLSSTTWISGGWVCGSTGSLPHPAKSASVPKQLSFLFNAALRMPSHRPSSGCSGERKSDLGQFS